MKTKVALAFRLGLAALRADSLKDFGQAEALFYSAENNKSDRLTGGLRFDKHLDPLRLMLHARGDRTAAITRPPSGGRRPRTFLPAVSIDRHFFIASLLDLFTHNRRHKSWKYRLFKRILSTAKPSVVFGIGGRDYLWTAARDLGIDYVEVVHAKGYFSLDSLFPGATQFPQKYIAFDAQTVGAIRRVVGSAAQVFLSTDYWVDSFLFPKNQSWAEPLIFHSPPVTKPAVLRIVVTLPPLPDGELPLFLEPTLRRLGSDGFWMVRQHQNQIDFGGVARLKLRTAILRMMQRYENIEFDASSRAPLPALFANSTHHITTGSSSSYEAAQIGVPTLAVSSHWGEQDKRQLAPLELAGFLEFSNDCSLKVEQWIRGTKSLRVERWHSGGEDIGVFLLSALP